MLRYILKRLILLPITLFAIILVNFVIINLAPGEPAYSTDVSRGEAVQRTDQVSTGEERYLQFREFFGLTLPILFNTWPWTTQETVLEELKKIATEKNSMVAKEYAALKIRFGDRARYVLPALVAIMLDEKETLQVRQLALFYFVRGATRYATIGVNLSEKELQQNRQIAKSNLFLDEYRRAEFANVQEFNKAASNLKIWFEAHQEELRASPTTLQKCAVFFFETRFSRYMKRVLTLDFGVLRADNNRTVISEVVSRMKYSLTLALIPMIVTFFLCQLFGLFMAVRKDSIAETGLNVLFLLLYAAPVFVVGPFLIEKVALHHDYPFTSYPFPIRGFSSEDSIYNSLTSLERVGDIFRHITLPLITVFYGSLAMQSRLSRAIFLDTLSFDYVRTARAKGVSKFSLYFKHVGRNASIPILTAVAGSLGLILGGSVIIETIFEIHGFGKFFYDAILTRDYNVMMFSAISGAALALIGYLVADIAYMWLDPRVSLEAREI